MTSPTLRSVKGSPLTNDEVDANFTLLYDATVTLDGYIADINSAITTINNTTIPNGLAGKQNLNTRLTNLSTLSSDGIVSKSGDSLYGRTLTSASALLTITNGDGVSDNPTFTLDASILTAGNTKTITNKSISGTDNTITNLDTGSIASGILSLARGGTNSGTAGGARASLGVLKAPGSDTGILVKNGSNQDAVVTRTLEGGAGIVISNVGGVNGNPSISLDSATQTILNQVHDLVYTTDNPVYTGGSYSNPSWLVSLAGSKVYNIPNTSLVNNTITINGTTISLGGSANVGVAALGTSYIAQTNKALNTNIVNTTGNYLNVYVRTQAATYGSYIVGLVNGVEAGFNRDNGSANANKVWLSVTMLVPPGATYRVNTYDSHDNVTTHTIMAWSELR